MTKKDYIKIANVIRQFRQAGAEADGQQGREIGLQNAVIYRMANKLAEELLKDNPKFDRKRFLIACECLPYGEAKDGTIRDIINDEANHYHGYISPSFIQDTNTRNWKCTRCGADITDKEMSLVVRKIK